jgi:excisionase family DNA binding protein
MKSLESQLLTTGQAAGLLGSSRQHIVDLCQRGQLDYQTTGAHRRLRRADVEALARRRRGVTREELRSLWLNRAVAAQLAQDPERVLGLARENLARFRRIHEGRSAEQWLKRWEWILDQGPELAMETLTSTAPEAFDLRQNSPFPGALNDSQRHAVLDAFDRYWRQRVA